MQTYNKVQKAITTAKVRLLKKAIANKGVYENFGQREVQALEDKYINSSCYTSDMNTARNAIQAFSEWCATLDDNRIHEAICVKCNEQAKLQGFNNCFNCQLITK